jgi:fructosamine-3-kinase
VLVIYDPASFYGHHEFDLAITRMFGGFRKEFYERYHQLIPREIGFEERKPLYELFHYLNHWYVNFIFRKCFGPKFRKNLIPYLGTILVVVTKSKA